jgi:hypothetical protein
MVKIVCDIDSCGLYKAINLWQQDNIEYIKESRFTYDQKKKQGK